MTPAALADLHAASITEPRPWRTAEFAALLGAPGVFHAADPTGLMVGRRLGPGPGAEAELLTLAVHPAARRAGRGRALLAAFEAASGAARAVLEVAEDNAPARALYAAAGWTAAGRRPRYYRGGRVDALILSKALPAGPGGTGCP